MSDEMIDDLGPVDYLVVEFPAGQSNFNGEMAAELASLNRAGTIRLLDLLILQKDADGAIEAFEVDELQDALHLFADLLPVHAADLERRVDHRMAAGAQPEAADTTDRAARSCAVGTGPSQGGGPARHHRGRRRRRATGSGDFWLRCIQGLVTVAEENADGRREGPDIPMARSSSGDGYCAQGGWA